MLQELLIYKCLSQQTVAAAGKSERKSVSESIFGYSSCLDASAMAVQDEDFALVGRLSLPDPILALRKVDMTGDGLLEIGVLTLKGLHILQVSFSIHEYGHVLAGIVGALV